MYVSLTLIISSILFTVVASSNFTGAVPEPPPTTHR